MAKLYYKNEDLVLVIAKQGIPKTDLIRQIVKVLNSTSEYNSISIIKEGRHPILKTRIGNLRLECYINRLDLIEESNEVAKNMKAWPEAYYLTYFMLMFLKQRDLNNVAQGGVTLFVLHCLTVAFVKHYKKRIASRGPKDLENALLSEYCLKFLEFYGLQFDNSKLKLVLGSSDTDKDSGFVEKTNSRDNSFNLFYPQISHADLGSSAFKVREVFNCLKNRYFFMTNYNFIHGESIMKYLVNPSKTDFSIYLK